MRQCRRAQGEPHRDRQAPEDLFGQECFLQAGEALKCEGGHQGRYKGDSSLEQHQRLGVNVSSRIVLLLAESPVVDHIPRGVYTEEGQHERQLHPKPQRGIQQRRKTGVPEHAQALPSRDRGPRRIVRLAFLADTRPVAVQVWRRHGQGVEGGHPRDHALQGGHLRQAARRPSHRRHRATLGACPDEAAIRRAPHLCGGLKRRRHACDWTAAALR
mmetsp:Transcript_39035/g.125477  ORF Transcript_39035/g.125477 Transcript_39035/m.125477 type:complete len:215 (-) Transcript_39035:126-770(-)